MIELSKRNPGPAAPRLVATVCAALLAACSGGSGSNAGQPAGDTPAIDDVLPESYRQIWAPFSGDYDAMVERRLIRVVTPYGGYMYFFDDGEPRGATWELTQRLENWVNRKHGNRNIRVYVVVTPLARDRLIPALLDGHADIIAADLTMTRMRSEQVAFTRPLLTDVNEVVVLGARAPDLESLDELSGLQVHVRRSSSYYEHLEALSASMRERGLKPPEIVLLDELLESEDILDMLNAGMIDITVLDDYKANFWAEVFPDIDVRNDLVVHEGGSIAWVVRQDATMLKSTLDDFLGQYGRGTLVGNDTFNRYLDDARVLRCSTPITSGERLASLADTFKAYGEQYDVDWLKLAAQAFQESRFRQGRESPAGAIGVMQIKASTASDPNVGIDDITTVDGNVHAGTKYLRFLIDRYFDEESIDPLNRWLLALAAYNAGPARVIELRREAGQSGYDPNVWFNNVEIIAARRIGRETITYVSNIFKYYTGYQMAAAQITETEKRHGDMLGSCRAP